MIHTFNNPISGQQEADIFDPVVVNPEIIVFPWYPPEQQKVASHTQFQYLLEVHNDISTVNNYNSTCIMSCLGLKGSVKQKPHGNNKKMFKEERKPC